MRDLLLTIHILAAAAWFGTNVVQIVVSPGIGRKGPAAAADWHRQAVAFGTRIYTPAALTSLVTGILLIVAVDFGWEFSDPFVSIGFVAVLAGAGLGMGFFAPTGRKAAEAYDAGDLDAAKAIEGRLAAVGMLDTLIVVVTVVAMVGKWGV